MSSEGNTGEAVTVPASEFLESMPPNQWATTTGFAVDHPTQVQRSLLTPPDIRLYCVSDDCNGYRFFASQDSQNIVGHNSSRFVYFNYRCRNRGKSTKVFSLWMKIHKDGATTDVLKFGEWPEFGPPTPSRVIKLIGPDRDAFLKGRRSENQGLGIGAFVYYRRVVENQKNRILDEIIKVSEKLSADDAVIKELNAAKDETQFSKAIDSIKHGIPQALLINGHNPLGLLHSALSEGLHAQTDEDCLSLATSIRVVLTDLADRLGQAMKDEAELNHAVSRLLQVKGNKGAEPRGQG